MMSHYERVQAAIEHREPDALPVGFKATDDVISNLKRRLDVTTLLGVIRALPVDTYGVFNNTNWGIFPRYVGGPKKVFYPDAYPDGTWDTLWGYKRRWAPAAGGRNDEAITHPLAGAETVSDIEGYEWPRTDWFDYSTIAEQSREVEDYAIMFLVGGLGHFANLIGHERFFMEMALNPKMMEAGFCRTADFLAELTERTLQAACGRINIICIQDDFGTQRGPMISNETYRRFFKPHHRRIFEIGHKYGARNMQHSCGAVFDFIPSFIEIGADILDPIQTTAAGMQPARLKREFGKDLCFHGGIDTQNVLVHGTTEDVRRHIDSLIREFSGNGGFVLAPSHYIQEDAPLENVLAVFDQATRWRGP